MISYIKNTGLAKAAKSCIYKKGSFRISDSIGFRIQNAIIYIMLIILLMIKISQTNAQQANIWYFGTKAGLNFNTTPPTVLTNGAIITPTVSPGMEGEGVASISDNSGNLLFYTDGVTVYNRNHVAMPNGSGLSGHASSAQSAIIIPKPGSSTNYFIITAPLTNTTTGIRYNEVNMTLNGGLGDIIAGQKNLALAPGAVRMMEAIAAVPHSNGTDFWIIAHDGAGSNTFRVYRATSAGISLSSSVNVGYTIPAGGSDIGMLKANSCYTKLAIAYHSSEVVDILNFNNTTGNISAPVSVTNFGAGDGVYGLEFSPNGNYLYVTGLYNKILYQYNITSGVAATINASRVVLGYGHADANRLAALQLGPDGKIYAANHSWGPYNANPSSVTYVGVINNPNNAGAAAGWTNNAIAVPSIEGPSNVFSGVKHGLPTLLKSFVSSSLVINNSAVCLGQPITFSYSFSGEQSGSVTWNFGDGSPISNTASPTKTYATAGSYTVQLSLTDICGNTITTTKIINVADTRPTVSYTCGSNSITLTGTSPGAGNSGYLIYGGSGFTQFLSNTNTYVMNPATLPVSFLVYGTGADQNTSYANIGTGYPQANNYVDFNANTPFSLKSIRVRPDAGAAGCSGTATATFTLRQGATVIATRNVAINCSGGIQTINLNIGIAAGTGYRLESNIGFYYVAGWEAGSYPWRNVSAVTYTGASHGMYGPFSDWVISTPANNCSFRQIDLNTSNCVLPVELIAFTAERKESSNILTWTTASEKNNNHFIIEKSTDGIHFYSIGIIEGKGTTKNISFYNFTDYSPADGTNYYRLKQVDTDGSFNYSETISLQFEREHIVLLPNPATDKIKISSPLSMIKEIIIVNSIGQEIVYINNIEETETEINLQDLTKGIYFARVISLNGVHNLKFKKE
ncbi:MAG: PKD domain-containing protein [Cytophagaceae bacterium]